MKQRALAILCLAAVLGGLAVPEAHAEDEPMAMAVEPSMSPMAQLFQQITAAPKRLLKRFARRARRFARSRRPGVIATQPRPAPAPAPAPAAPPVATPAPRPAPGPGAPPAPLPATCVGADPVLVDHVLSRIGYGPNAESRERARCLGLPAYIEEQLAPAGVADPDVDAILSAYPTVGMSLSQLKRQAESSPALSNKDEAKRVKLLRAVYSRRQLEQVLVDFWFDHLNVDAGDGIANWAVMSYERDAIRAHVLGRLGDMLLASARHPAMLDYLDNAYSRKDTVDRNGVVKKGLNENYGREFLELHSVGVDGGYTQADVVAVARAFTGWTVDWDFRTDGFRFDAGAHDTGAKTVMGALQIPAGGGEQDGRAVVQFAATHPMTAERVSRLLVSRFIDEQPPLSVVVRAQQKYLETGGDLREVMRVILLSDEFLSLAHQRAKVKRPLVFVASFARAAGLGFATVRDRGVRDVQDLGEILLEAKPPTGYPDVSTAWGGPGALLARFNLLQGYADNAASRGLAWTVPGTTTSALVQELANRLVAGPLSGASRQAAIAFVSSLPQSTTAQKKNDQAAALVLATPEFMHH